MVCECVSNVYLMCILCVLDVSFLKNRNAPRRQHVPRSNVPPHPFLEILSLRTQQDLERPAMIPLPRENKVPQGSETRHEPACSTRNHLKSSCDVLFKCGTISHATSG